MRPFATCAPDIVNTSENCLRHPCPCPRPPTGPRPGPPWITLRGHRLRCPHSFTVPATRTAADSDLPYKKMTRTSIANSIRRVYWQVNAWRTWKQPALAETTSLPRTASSRPVVLKTATRPVSTKVPTRPPSISSKYGAVWCGALRTRDRVSSKGCQAELGL